MNDYVQATLDSIDAKIGRLESLKLGIIAEFSEATDSIQKTRPDGSGPAKPRASARQSAKAAPPAPVAAGAGKEGAEDGRCKHLAAQLAALDKLNVEFTTKDFGALYKPQNPTARLRVLLKRGHVKRFGRGIWKKLTFASVPSVPSVVNSSEAPTSHLDAVERKMTTLPATFTTADIGDRVGFEQAPAILEAWLKDGRIREFGAGRFARGETFPKKPWQPSKFSPPSSVQSA